MMKAREILRSLWSLRMTGARRVLPAAVVVLTFAILTLAVTWPLVTRLNTNLAQNPRWSRDAYQQAYEMWWFKKALLELGESPGHLSWIYFPDGADYPLLLTYFTTYVVGVPLLLFLSPVATYNVVLLLTFFLSGLTAYALCAHLTQNRWAGLLGGIVYAFFPGRVAHALAGHMELIAIYLFPLYLLLLIKTVRKPRAATAILCGLTLGVSLLVQPLFIPFLLVPFTAIWLLCEMFLLKRKIERRAWLALAGALGLGVLIAAPFFWPVLSQQATGQASYLEGIGTVSFSADLLGIVTPSPVNPVLDTLGIVPPYVHRVAPDDWRIAELLTYAGLMPLALGALATATRRHQVAAWALVAILAAVLSLGPALKVNGEVVSFAIDDVGGSTEVTVALPYALLAKVPLLSLNRAPARINTTLMLALAVLSAYGLAWLTERVRRGKIALAIGICIFTLIELAVIWPFPTMPVQTPAYLTEIATSDNGGAILNLPVAAGHVKQLSIFQQTIHQHPVFDSWFQRDLPVFPNVADFLDGLLMPETQEDIVPSPRPDDRAAVARAEEAGYVFLHTPYVGDAEAKMRLLESEFGLPRSAEEGIAIYEVTPGSTAASDLVYAVPNNDWRSPERGWHYAEEWNGQPARWMAASAELYIYSPNQRDGVLQFRALPFAAPQRLQIEVNREPLPPLVIGDWITYTAPSVTLQPGLNQISMRALDGCTSYAGDPRCSGVTRGVAGEDAGCSRYVQGERCLGVLFQAVRFTEAADQPLDVDLGDQIRLLGYDLIPLPDREGLGEGKSLSLTLYWQALHPPQDDYTVFVHLLDFDGNLAAQHDGLPLNGIYPTSEWAVGDIFTQQVDLEIPSGTQAGVYDLAVGMYTYPDIVRLPISGDRPYARDGLVWLQSVQIDP
ncbi:MAG: hypothetical protein JXA14_09645 [Anaerolineae bacterium]|nr:hypothetical protein [Anaerolineae bacterium]